VAFESKAGQQAKLSWWRGFASIDAHVLFSISQQVVELVRALVTLRHGDTAAAAASTTETSPAARGVAHCKTPSAAPHRLADDAEARQSSADIPPGGVDCANTAAARRDPPGDVNNQNTGNDEELRRLATERAALVATGIYGGEDALIRQLDARIGRLYGEQRAK